MRARKWWAVPVAVAAAAAAIVAMTGTASATPAASKTVPIDYYLSLGDSLSVGVQPGADGTVAPTRHGFDRDLLPGLRVGDRLRGRNLRLTELGCSGESTQTMIDGGICDYHGASSQMDAAVAFLAAHRGHVPLVTVTIGANDVDECVTATGIDLGCVQRGFAAIAQNLATITARLTAADPNAHTRFIGLNEYDPFLAVFLQGTAGQQEAAQSVGLVDQLNELLGASYQNAGFRVADVAGAFRTGDSTDQVTLSGVGTVPVNVANICRLTFECTPAPVGPNIHPTNAGYRVMAAAVLATLRGNGA